MHHLRAIGAVALISSACAAGPSATGDHARADTPISGNYIFFEAAHPGPHGLPWMIEQGEPIDAASAITIRWWDDRLLSCPGGNDFSVEGRYFDAAGGLLTPDASLPARSFTTELVLAGGAPSAGGLHYYDASLDIPRAARRLSLWFHEIRCGEYDSNTGRNYDFNVQPPVGSP